MPADALESMAASAVAVIVGAWDGEGVLVCVPDALIAAAAADRGWGVLHYHAHFDRLATVLGFTSQWVAPAGTIP